jgi:hypothetical protein
MWPLKNSKKFGALVGGFAIYALTATPQTEGTLREYLLKQGYAQVSVQGPQGTCGRGKRRFEFQGVWSDGRHVGGEACMASHSFFYAITLHQH